MGAFEGRGAFAFSRIDIGLRRITSNVAGTNSLRPLVLLLVNKAIYPRLGYPH